MWELRPRGDAALVQGLSLFEGRIAPRAALLQSHARRLHGVWELRPRSDGALVLGLRLFEGRIAPRRHSHRGRSYKS